MRKISLHQVDAFTDTLFGGNPAGVVTNADGLTVTDMTNIAREMNLSETAFVLKSTDKNADLQLRFFTPLGNEIDFCGHATIGTLFQLATMKMFGLGKMGKNIVRVQTKAETLTMSVINHEDSSARVGYAAPKLAMEPYPQQGAAFTERLGIPASLLKSDGTILIDRKLNYVYIPVASLAALQKQTFDFAHIRKSFGFEGTVVFCLFTNETVSEQADICTRGLAPNVGVDEDPFTGSMQAGMAYAARQNGMVPIDQQYVRTEQGHSLGRPGFAIVNFGLENDPITIEACAVTVFSTELEMPA